MPQNPMVIYDAVTGIPVWMHSIDVAEAVHLGDYTLTPVEGLEPTDAVVASALETFRGVSVPR